MTDMAGPNDLKILGTATSAGGTFLNVKVTGECHFNGDVECRRMSVTGNSKVAGSLKAEKLKITGELEIDRSLELQSLRGQGEVKAASARIEQLDFNGSLKMDGACEAERLQISGAVDVEGLLSADHLEINLFGPSRAKEIGGSNIAIKRSKAGKLLHVIKAKKEAFFTAGLIEGDSVELHYTKADIVRGERVIIGADCLIGTVEYRETLEIHKNAVVKHQVKV